MQSESSPTELTKCATHSPFEGAVILSPKVGFVIPTETGFFRDSCFSTHNLMSYSSIVESSSVKLRFEFPLEPSEASDAEPPR